MLKFEYKMIKENWSKCPDLSEGESIKTLKFEDTVGNQSKCWNLSANGQIDQNVEIWVKRQQPMKMLKFEQKMRGSTNVYVLLQKWESIKMLEFEC